RARESRAARARPASRGFSETTRARPPFATPTPADQVREPDALTPDRQTLYDAGPGCLNIPGHLQPRVHREPKADLLEGRIQLFLTDAQVFGRRPTGLEQRLHRSKEAQKQLTRPRFRDVTVESRLRAARGNVQGAVLQRHGSGQTLDLVQCHAAANTRPAAGDPAHKTVDHDVSLAARDRVGPDYPQVRFLAHCSLLDHVPAPSSIS